MYRLNKWHRTLYRMQLKICLKGNAHIYILTVPFIVLLVHLKKQDLYFYVNVSLKHVLITWRQSRLLPSYLEEIFFLRLDTIILHFHTQQRISKLSSAPYKYKSCKYLQYAYPIEMLNQNKLWI